MESPKGKRNRTIAWIVAGVILAVVLFLVIFRVIRLVRADLEKRRRYEAYLEGMSELTPEEIEEIIRQREAQDALSGLGDAESLAGLAANDGWKVDSPQDQGWSLSKAAPFFLKIRFDRQYEMVTEKETAMWRRTYKNEYVWDTDAVTAYVMSLKEKYDTPVGEVSFTTHDGRALTFYTQNCGWHMNVDETVQMIKDAAVQNREVVDPIWNSGLIYSASNGVGNKYVEVDIPAQKVFLYRDGKQIMESDCVTGFKGVSDTVPGVYQVMYKASPSVLKDEDRYGNKYEQPVNYWISFNYSQGLHDALWRYSFGGDIYLTAGSHGCVNLPEEAAATIYSEVHNYFPVVVYDESISGVLSQGTGNPEQTVLEEPEAGSSPEDEIVMEDPGTTEETEQEEGVALSAGLPDVFS